MHTTPASVSPRGTPSRRGKSPRFPPESPSQASSSTLPANFTNEPISIFTSSLNILVEGATPIESNSDKETSPGDRKHDSTGEPKRAPRKSKTEALAALRDRARSVSPNPGDDDHSMNTDEYRIPVAPKLDLSTVKTASPRQAQITNQEPRPFGLEDCPEFYPTAEEFKDPMAYVRSISDHAKNYGICKIIPPEGWKMPFVTDTETFRFRTRLQRLNSIEASSRAKLNFLEQLYRYHKQQGNIRVVVPTINHKPLDLWLLRKEVQKMGGYEMVTKEKKWSDVGRLLGYRGIPGLSTQIKNSYARVILPYEHFCEKAKNTPGIAPVVHDPQLKTHTNIQSSGKLSRPLSEPPDESESRDADGKPASSRPRRSTRMGSQEQQASSSKKPVSVSTPVIPPPIFYDKPKVDTKGTPEQNCEVCHKKDRGEEMLLCDGCDCGFHMFCLQPPLTVIPKDQWFCYTCLSGTGGDFGFDEGEEHSLSSFQARDKEFRRRWWKEHVPESTQTRQENDPKVNLIGDVYVSEYDVEKEFWRLVQSPYETVEVEYGADVHSTTHGSAMPTLETHPLDPYSKDAWNVNNIPIVSDSLLRYIKSDISGMTVPWTYVGMAFSTFCWHNEDHYTYSVNYMHWGETKTWYGIPGDDAEKFEAAIKCEAPDLFEAQPDLLFQLVTLMNPQRLTEAGVRVYACNQRAGEFVITFPKAYHAGFNHGLNFNEAVNFALPDWLSYGRECVQRYREHRKLPVFSHDELLITITQQSQSIKTATWLNDSLKEMVNREMADRAKARSMGLPEVLQEEDRLEDQYQCTICKAFCYLSFIMCQCTSNVACVDHAGLLCEPRPTHQLTLRKRFSDEELLDTQSKFAERAAMPSTWRSKLSKVLMESPRPPLRSLRALLAEGDRINYPLPELNSLRKCVNRANEWVDAANTFTVRKQSRKRSKRPRGRPSINDGTTSMDDPGDRPDRSLDDLYALLREVETLGFDCPEIGTLRTLAQHAEETKKKASALLSSQPADEDREAFLQECKRLLLDGSSINVILDELLEVEKIVDREQLVTDLEEKFEDEDTPLTLEEVRQLLTRARTCNISPHNKHLRMLEERQKAGNNWEERAKNILAQPVKTIEELEDFAEMDSAIPIDPGVSDRLMAALAKAKDFDKQARAWLNPEPDAPKPRVLDVMRMVNRAEKDFSIPSVKNLKRTAEIAMDLETRCDHVLRNRYHRDKEDVFETIGQWKAYAQEHLKMFVLPIFDKLNTQIKLHEQWLKDLPWYCKEHKEPHGQAVYDDVMACTNPEDDMPPTDEYVTCICTTPVRPPPPGQQSDAVQCDHCFARFHGDCAKNGGSCPFCDHHHWNGAIHKERNWHFCYLPNILMKAPEITKFYSDEWKQLEVIVHRLDRLSVSIGQFLSFTSQPVNQDPKYIHQVRHFMRKLYKIQFAVSPNPEISFGLDLAGLHRILAGGRPPIARPKKRRRPRFVFGQDVDQDWSDGTRCICRGRTHYLLNYPTVSCESCNKLYHAGCVFYPGDTKDGARFTCPLCCLRKNVPYQYSDVRVKPTDQVDPDVYVDTQEMLETFSKDVIYKKMAPPYAQTLFVELVRFVPGQPQSGNTATSTPRSSSSHHQSPRSLPPHPVPPHHDHYPHQRSPPMPSDPYTGSPAMQHVPPPPPWSRWGAMATPARPPSIQRRPSESSQSTPPLSALTARKRKHPEDLPSPEEMSRVNSSSSTGPPPKRRPMPSAPLSPPLAPMRPVQTLSPSLAMIVSPVNQTVMTSPRSPYIPPPLRNGTGGSPPMPHGGKPLMMQ
ncbi:putative BRIGHT, ARID (A/T-rich interaction domain) domain contatining protein [Lyophyllum shimeji]|uniref:[histone H3]-trimethyl-L-lysine(4) demethylase n=1 Tax=Lyophyllum shimeji TaxID=47721 RepID=A0A9P3UHJ7_LYOSH|nr:putative BRIGHT, ARID (A/T-rich interaction domain) domain contatining protein [Lyophyllum shimeji]